MYHKQQAKRPMPQVAGKQILIVGGGVSGIAAAAFLQSKGAIVTITDNKTPEQADPLLLGLAAKNIRLVLGQMPRDVSSFQLVVVSPGVPLTIPVLQKAQAANIPILGELELAYLFSHNPWLAITGTNGKTTTTSLVGHILDVAQIDCVVGGNIGIPLITRVEGLDPKAYIVAEVSSFQLETAEAFVPKVGAFLNLTPDHLNRHLTMENYGNIKAKILTGQGEEDTAVLNYDDPLVRAYAEKTKAQILFFSRKSCLDQGIWLENGRMVYCDGRMGQELLQTEELLIRGGHNLENAMAAAAIALAIGLSPQVIRQALTTFSGVEHRQELVRVCNGVTYINDSKGTNPDSTLQALLAYDQPMVLILGGRNKGGNFEPLLPLIRAKVKQVVLVGEAAPELKAVLDAGGYFAIAEAGFDFERCVALAIEAACPGDVVMLSPACASWDMFGSFEERGALFKKCINNLQITQI